MSALICPSRHLKVSFEFFPPKSEAAAQKLWRVASTLSAFDPEFSSVTYGAGGSTRDTTIGTLDHLIRTTDMRCAGHLTCVDHSKSAIDAVIRQYVSIGVRHVLALRGDPSSGVGSSYQPHPEGYQSTADLVAAIKAVGNMDVSVSAYPEKHPESSTIDVDLDILAAKVDAGANRALTQFFFSNDNFLRFRDRAAARGIAVPLVPGIMPVANIVQVSRFAKSCGANIPKVMRDRFLSVADTPEARNQMAVDFAIDQINGLVAEGVSEFHLYTMNRADLAGLICEGAGLGRPDIRHSEHRVFAA